MLYVGIVNTYCNVLPEPITKEHENLSSSISYLYINSLKTYKTNILNYIRESFDNKFYKVT